MGDELEPARTICSPALPLLRALKRSGARRQLGVFARSPWLWESPHNMTNRPMRGARAVRGWHEVLQPSYPCL